MKLGVLVLPILKETSIPLIKNAVKGFDILSNYKLGVPHTMIKFTESDDIKKVFGDKTLRIKPPDNVDMSDVYGKYLAFMMSMVERVDKLLIVAPNKTPLLFVIIAAQRMAIDNIRVIINDKFYTAKAILESATADDVESAHQQWLTATKNRVESSKIEHAPSRVYTEDELTRVPNGARLRPYQQQMLDFAISHKRVGLFIDMGLGKTLATLATIQKLVDDGSIDSRKPILIVAPILVAIDTWSREAEKWGYNMDVLINIRLRKNKREQLFEKLLKPMDKLTLVTTNPSQLRAMREFFTSHRVRSPFEVVVVDELSQFKSPFAKRSDDLQSLSRYAPYFMGLTGTPAPNNLLDIWNQLLSIDMDNGKRFGYNFYDYRSRFFLPDSVARDGTVYSYKLMPKAEDKIYELMRPTVISMRSEGLIDLPAITYSNRYITLPKNANNIYQDLDITLRQELNRQEELDKDERETITYSTGNSELNLANNAVLTSKLSQITSGAIYDNIMELNESSSHNQHYEVIHNEKLKALKEIVESATSPILVFYNFKSELDRLAEYIDYEQLNPKADNVKDVIARWNRGEIPVLVGHPGSIGHGLNLQDGGHTIVWLTTTWSNEQYRQAVKRLYRSGQTHPVSVIHIVAKGTVDEEVIARVNEKEDSQDKLMTALDVANRG